MIKKKLIINNFNKDNFYIFIGLGIIVILNFSNTFSIRVKTAIFMKKRILNEILDIEICIKFLEDYRILKKYFLKKISK